MGGTEVGLLVWLLTRLPERYVKVLWLTEIESRTSDEVASSLGLEPRAAVLLVHHAREGVRQAYLREQPGPAPAPGCAAVRRALPAYVRGAASVRDAERAEAHLEGCRDCRRRDRELRRAARFVPLEAALLELASRKEGAFLAPMRTRAPGPGVTVGPLRFGSAANDPSAR